MKASKSTAALFAVAFIPVKSSMNGEISLPGSIKWLNVSFSTLTSYVWPSI